MSVALLATGNEIIEGDIQNTNSRELALALSSEGLAPRCHVSCSDLEADIYDCLQFLSHKHDIILITGGLGPTSDDRTRFALSRFLNDPLIVFPESQAHLEKILRNSKLAQTLSNQQQTYFPSNAILLQNPHGTAMGCYCASENKIFFMLPGPPRECLPMFHEYVLPLLQKTLTDEKQLLKWRLFGVAESEIGQRLDDALKHLDCETGYRLETPYVEFKVRCHPQWFPQVHSIVEPIIAPHVIAGIHKKASELLCELIVQKQVTTSIIDEVTGGLLQTLIVQPKTYPLLNFYDNSKSLIQFQLEGLKEYWLQQEGHSSTLTISYKYGQQHGHETHDIPYRSAMVVHYAAEWLSFRLFHLINQLHQ